MKKIKKILSVTLALVLGVAAVGMVACKGKHTHAFSKYCYDTMHHWLACEGCAETKEKERHVNDGEGYCKGCDHLIPSEGVTYTLSSDGKYALVTGYDETETSAIVLSPIYGNVPVKEIAPSAFEGCEDLERVTMAESITTIGDNAFKGCENMSGILLSKQVTRIGDYAFAGCENLTIFCQAESKPNDWSENWKTEESYAIWGYTGKRMSAVSAKAIPVADGMLGIIDPDRAQLVVNTDLDGVRVPEGFSTVARYDVRKEGAQAWETSALWNYNYDQTDLKEYGEVWFAVKAVNAYWALGTNSKLESPNWAFLQADGIGGSPWVYVHLKQSGKDRLGYILWDIEVSIGGCVYAIVDKQSGKPIDKDRPINSISRLLWDNGFSSEDGSTILLYSEEPKSSVFYCTEVVGVRVGA